MSGTVQQAPPASQREATFLIAGGMKKVGKTYKTLQEINRYLLKTRRKVLILDVNGEYGNVKSDHNPNFAHVRALTLSDLSKWTLNGIPEIRRIRPVDEKTGRPLTTDQLMDALNHILENFKNGALVLEDLTKIVSDSVGMALIGMLSTNRHASVDIFIHFQSIQKIVNPKMWALSNVIRLHKCEDDVKKHASKMSKAEGLFLCENLVQIINEKNNDDRACIYYHKEVNKIKGPFNETDFVLAVEMFLEKNPKIFNGELARVNIKTGAKIHKDRMAAYNHVMSKYKKTYL
jgi:hypothetical protein